MSFLYVVEPGSTVGIEGGKIKILHKNNEIVYVPKETVEGVAIFGNSQITTQATQYFLEKGLRVSFFSKHGSYYGCLISTGHVNVARFRNQVHLTEDDNFSINISKNIIKAKINNLLAVSKRFLRNLSKDDFIII